MCIRDRFNTNFKINDNTIFGSNKAWIRDANEEPVANGATGDMLAIKSVDGFEARGNELRNSGEYGLTCIGSKNGSIIDNEIYRSDGSGIAISNESENVIVKHNLCQDVGMNRAGGVTYQAGIRVFDGLRGVAGASPQDIVVNMNTLRSITSLEYKYGIQVSHKSSVRLDSNNTFTNTNGSIIEEVKIVDPPGNAAHDVTILIAGDVNRDSIVNFSDVAGFIAALTSGDYDSVADMNDDLMVGFLDIDLFIQSLSAP